MWTPGFFLGPAAILVGALLLVFREQATRVFQSVARLIRDPRPDRFSPGILIVPAVGAICIGVAVIVLSIFLQPN